MRSVYRKAFPLQVNKEQKQRFLFGDIVVNENLSQNNPKRKGIVVRMMKMDQAVELTDGHNEFWVLKHSRGNKTKKIGSIINQDAMI